MTVDVLYEGVALAHAAKVREEGKGAFVELEAPMPVGTRLVLRGPDGERVARVERVMEGATSGVEVRFVDERGGRETAPGAVREAAGGEPVEPEPEPAEPKDGEKRGRKDKRGQKRRNTNAH